MFFGTQLFKYVDINLENYKYDTIYVSAFNKMNFIYSKLAIKGALTAHFYRLFAHINSVYRGSKSANSQRKIVDCFSIKKI